MKQDIIFNPILNLEISSLFDQLRELDNKIEETTLKKYLFRLKMGDI